MARQHMGLMNVGSSEGAQIIQLFGRGVRLKGYDMSLKRSGKAQLPEGVDAAEAHRLLETLEHLRHPRRLHGAVPGLPRRRGLPTNDDRIEFLLPVIKNLGTQKLKTIRLKKTINGVSTEFGDAFRKLGPVPTLAKPDPAATQHRVPAEEPGRSQLVPEDPGDEVGRRGRAAMRTPRPTRRT